MTNVRETVWTLVKKKELECGIRLSFPYPNWRFNIVIDVLNTGSPPLPSPPLQLILLWQVCITKAVQTSNSSHMEQLRPG